MKEVGGGGGRGDLGGTPQERRREEGQDGRTRERPPRALGGGLPGLQPAQQLGARGPRAGRAGARLRRAQRPEYRRPRRRPRPRVRPQRPHRLLQLRAGGVLAPPHAAPRPPSFLPSFPPHQ